MPLSIDVLITEKHWVLSRGIRYLALPEPHEYVMGIAAEVMRRCSCLRHAVGAVIVVKQRVVSTGYNGTAQGLPNCMDMGCERCQNPTHKQGEGYDTCVCVHAEANAIVAAARHGVSIDGGVLYTTMHPCFGCMKEALQAGIQEIYYIEDWEKASSPEYQKFIEPSKVKPAPLLYPHLRDRVESQVDTHDEDVIEHLLRQVVQLARPLKSHYESQRRAIEAVASSNKGHQSRLTVYRRIADRLYGTELGKKAHAYLELYYELDVAKWSAASPPKGWRSRWTEDDLGTQPSAKTTGKPATKAKGR